MTTSPRYLGLDLGTCTGYALVEGSKLIRSGVKDFSGKMFNSTGHRGIKFSNFLREFGTVDEIYYETIMFGGNFKNKDGKWVGASNDGRELFHGLLMLVNMFAAGYGINAFPVHPATLKKEFAGHGGADKAAMCATARAMGWRGGQTNTAMFHDEVDAIALLVTSLKKKYGVKVEF